MKTEINIKQTRNKKERQNKYVVFYKPLKVKRERNKLGFGECTKCGNA